MLVFSHLPRLVRLSVQMDQILVTEADNPIARFPLSEELSELMGHQQVRYFEATINHGMLTLGNNVAPP